MTKARDLGELATAVQSVSTSQVSFNRDISATAMSVGGHSVATAATIPTFGTDYIDSAEAIKLITANAIDSGVALQLLLDSIETIALIDSAYVQARQSAGTDSAATISLINATIDSDYLAEHVKNLEGNIEIKTNDDTSNAGPEFTLYRVSSSPADGDYLGQIKFTGKHDGGGDEIYAKITGKIRDASQGTEDGLIETAIKGNGSFTIVSRQRSDKLQLINSTGLEVAGDTTLSGSLTLGGATRNKVLDSNDIGLFTPSFIRVNRQNVSADFTLDSGLNAVAAGPIEIDSGVTVTVNGNWSIV